MLSQFKSTLKGNPERNSFVLSCSSQAPFQCEILTRPEVEAPLQETITTPKTVGYRWVKIHTCGSGTQLNKDTEESSEPNSQRPQVLAAVSSVSPVFSLSAVPKPTRQSQQQHTPSSHVAPQTACWSPCSQKPLLEFKCACVSFISSLFGVREGFSL